MKKSSILITNLILIGVVPTISQDLLRLHSDDASDEALVLAGLFDVARSHDNASEAPEERVFVLSLLKSLEPGSEMFSPSRLQALRAAMAQAQPGVANSFLTMVQVCSDWKPGLEMPRGVRGVYVHVRRGLGLAEDVHAPLPSVPEYLASLSTAGG